MAVTPNDLFHLPRRRRSPLSEINKEKRARRAEQIQLIAVWLAKNPQMEPSEIRKRLAAKGIELALETVEDYIRAARRL